MNSCIPHILPREEEYFKKIECFLLVIIRWGATRGKDYDKKAKLKVYFGNLQSSLFQTCNWKSKLFWALLRQNFGEYLQA
jgi:hypothetical protein